MKTQYRSGDKNDYRVGTVKGVVEKEETYKVNFKGGHRTLNLYLQVEIGGEADTRDIPILYISNKKLDERDLYKYIKELEAEGVKKPTISEIEEKRQTIDERMKKRLSSMQL